MRKSFAKEKKPVWKWALWAVAVAAVLWYMMTALSGMDSAQNQEGKRILEDSLRRAAVSSYTSVGRYPPSLAELVRRYGITIREDKYAVYYEIFADNIMPEITVIDLLDEGGRS